MLLVDCQRQQSSRFGCSQTRREELGEMNRRSFHAVGDCISVASG